MVGGLASGQVPALAQTPTVAPADLEQQYEAAFQEMLRQPANLDVLFKFASLATRTGDLEGAVSALERMLLINPNLPRVRLELGVLYYRLESYEIARSYLESALKSQALPPDVRGKAEQFMAEIEKRQNPSRFSGELFFGTRYQSNANLGPATSSVRLFGQTANLNQQALGTADWGFVSSAQFRHSYDLGLQDKSTLESQLTTYANRQFNLSAANVSLIDFTTGPRFQAFRGIFEEVILKPFLSAGYIWVNDQPYYGSYGAGLETAVLLADRLRNVSIFSWRQQNYPNTSYLPANSLFTGTQYSAATTFQYQLTQIVSLYGFGNAQRYQTQQTISQNYMLGGVGGGMAVRFADPLFKSGLPWSINLTVNQQWWQYDAADPIIDPGVVRQQADTIFNIVLSIPFDDRTTFSISGGRFTRASNLPNFEFTNNNVMFGVGWRF
jgi:tetratricopeptide (TPR) repeat protein